MIEGRLTGGACPGGLVFVQYDDDEVEVDRAHLDGKHEGDVVAAAVRQAGRMRRRGGQVVVYDGDTGRALLVLAPAGVLVLGRWHGH